MTDAVVTLDAVSIDDQIETIMKLPDEQMTREQIQTVAKFYGVKANLKSVEILIEVRRIRSPIGKFCINSKNIRQDARVKYVGGGGLALVLIIILSIVLW
jgi:hypothetical protein